MGVLGRLLGRRRRDRGGPGPASGGRPSEAEDLQHLRTFAQTKRGVEFYLEPRTEQFGSTVVAVAHDGEWTRRRVSGPKAAGRLAHDLQAPLYEAKVTGYPRRMKEWSRNHPERRLGPR